MRILLIILMLSSIILSGNHSSQPQLRVSYSSAGSPYIQEFPLPTLQAIPGPIAVAPNGTVWFAETNASSLTKFVPRQGFTEFPIRNSLTFILPSLATKSISSVATDSRGNVWFSLSSANAVGYLNITNRAFEYYNLTQLTNRTFDFPFGITLDSKQIAWVAETGASRIARLDPSNGSFHEYLLSQPNASPLEIFEDNSHYLWITSYWYTNVGRYPSSGSTLTKFDPSRLEIIQDYNLSAAGIHTPVGVAVDQSGSAWIGDHAGAWLGEVNTVTGEIKLHRTSLPPLNPRPQNLTDRVFDASITLVNDVVIGTDGTPWFIEHLGARVGHYIPANNTVIEYNIPTYTPITLWLAADRTGGIWFTEENGNKLGYLNTRNATPPFEVVSPSSTSAQVTTCGSSLAISIKNLSPNSINIAAGVENTFSFFGPITNVTIPGGTSTQVTVEISSSSSLLPGNYSSVRFLDLTPVIKVTDGNINYPITLFADVTNATICPGVLLYAAAGSILAFAGITGTMLFYKKKNNQRTVSLSQT